MASKRRGAARDRIGRGKGGSEVAGRSDPGGVLRAVLVSGRRTGSAELEAALERADCRIVSQGTPESDLAGLVDAHSPDLVVVDLGCPRRISGDAMRRLGSEQPRPLVVFVDESDPEAIDHAIRADVAAYVVRGAGEERIRSVLDVAMRRFDQVESLKAELHDVKTTLADRKLVERAKGVLMEKRGLSESEAFGTLRKLAMDRSARLRDVAARVVEQSDRL